MFKKIPLLVKVGIFPLVAGLVELTILGTAIYINNSLKGDTTVINTVGSERMRLFKLDVLLEEYNDHKSQETLAQLRAEMSMFEYILYALRDGSVHYKLKKTEDAFILANIHENIERWKNIIRPALQNVLSSETKTEFDKRLEGYRANVFTYVADMNKLVYLFEAESSKKVATLHNLQFAFLFVSMVIAAGSLVYIYLIIIKPLKRLNRASEAIASGDLMQKVPVLSKDEIGELGTNFNEMAIQLKIHIDSMDNMAVQLRSHIDALDEKIVEIDEEKQKYENLVNNLNIGIYRRMADGRIVEANDAAVAMFGAGSKEELLKHNVMDFYQDTNRMKEITDKIMKYGFLKDEELELRTAKGRKILCAVSGVKRQDKNGNFYFDNIVEDITVRRRLEEQVRHSQKMEAIGELAAGVAHEINNPLASMSVCVESLMKRLKPHRAEDNLVQREDYDRFMNYLKIIETEIYRAKNITTGLLDFSKERDLVIKNVDVNHTLDETIKLLLHQPKYKEFIVKINLDENLPMVLGDEGQLRQVFLVMIVNAFEAMKPGDVLEVSTTSGMDSGVHVVKIMFKDNGCGIPKENLNKIYEAFFTTKGHQGTGLGLSICYGIVSKHGGRIDVESEAGVGSKFIVVLPADPPQKNSVKLNSYNGDIKRYVKQISKNKTSDSR